MMNSKTRFVLHLLLGKDRSHLWLFIATLITNVIAALFEGISFAFIMLALSTLSGSATTTYEIKYLSGLLAKYSGSQPFVILISLAVISQILRSSLSYVGQVISMYLGSKIQIDCQQRVYAQILKMSFACVNRYKIGELLEYARIPPLLINILTDPINRILVAVFAILASGFTLFFLSVRLALFSVFVFTTLFFSQRFVISKISSISLSLSEHLLHFSKSTAQTLHGLRVIHTFHRQNSVMKQVLQTLGKIAKMTKHLNLWNQSIAPVNEVLGIASVGIFLVCGRAILPASDLPILLTFMLVIHRLNGRIQVLLSALGTIATHWGQITCLKDLLDESDKEYVSSGGASFEHLQYGIELKNVSFRYANCEEDALKEVNLFIPKHKTIGLIGASGAGKSSLIDLLVRLYDPTQGSVLVDHIHLKEIDLEFWRNQLGVVSQDSFIFNESIAENIRFGLPEANMEQVIEAAKMAGAHEFIRRLPEEYATIVGERGHRLSGGQRQRLSLARVLIRNPDILLLDEATSNLDTHSESLIQKALFKMQRTKTIIIVAHRLSTVRYADEIIVFEKGQIVECGSHDDLLLRKGRYAFYWEAQHPKDLEGSYR